MKVYLDGCDLNEIKKFNKSIKVSGFTTNPSLMAKAGVKNYESFSKKLLSIVRNKPVSLEVISDNAAEIEKQAIKLSSWQNNVYVKIPILNSKGQAMYRLIDSCIKKKIKLNITAVFTIDQVNKILNILKNNNYNTNIIISIFAGRIANTMRDPEETFLKVRKLINNRSVKKTQILWASPREILNIKHAKRSGADIITVTPDLYNQYLSLNNKNLIDYSRETSKMFLDDAKKSKFII